MRLLDQVGTALDALASRGLRRARREVTLASGAPGDCGHEGSRARHLVVDGRTLLAFCSNDYLGLSSHPQIAQAMARGALSEGAGSGASALISGHRAVHAQLEERLANLYQPWIASADALYLTSGYTANLALVDGLCDLAMAGTNPSVEIFSEALNHASLVDGTRIARAHHGARVSVYPHCDTEALASALARSQAASRIILTDSVFSMDGNLAPLEQLAVLAEAHDAWLVVDDAHGFGVLGGQGLGTLEHLALRSPNIILMGTLGKAAGVSGAFIAAHRTVIEWLVNRARTHVFSTASAPALAHALLAAIDIIVSDEGRERRAHLAQLSAQLQGTLRLDRWQCLPAAAAIHPIIIGPNDATLRAAAWLHEERLWVPAIRPPTVPVGRARLRVTLSAAHGSNDVMQLADALVRAERAEPTAAQTEIRAP